MDRSFYMADGFYLMDEKISFTLADHTLLHENF